MVEIGAYRQRTFMSEQAGWDIVSGVGLTALGAAVYEIDAPLVIAFKDAVLRDHGAAHDSAI
jgi:O-methyltransferase involved in polyketide biosynthesis